MLSNMFTDRYLVWSVLMTRKPGVVCRTLGTCKHDEGIYSDGTAKDVGSS